MPSASPISRRIGDPLLGVSQLPSPKVVCPWAASARCHQTATLSDRQVRLLLDMPRHDRTEAGVKFGERSIWLVEPQPALASSWSMAAETPPGKQRLHIPGKAHSRFGSVRRGRTAVAKAVAVHIAIAIRNAVCCNAINLPNQALNATLTASSVTVSTRLVSDCPTPVLCVICSPYSIHDGTER